MKKTTIRLLDHEFGCEMVDTSHMPDNAMGRSSLQHGYIHIAMEMPLEIQQSTFLHELIHMIADINSIDINEQSIDNFALGILSFVKHNPEMVKKLQRMS